MEVVDVDTIDLGAGGRPRRSRHGPSPLIPPPAIQIAEAVRVVVASLPPSDIGIRPNSPPQMTERALQAAPGAFRSVSGAGDRPVGLAHIRRVVLLDILVQRPTR